MSKQYYVYITGNNNLVLYTGITSDLVKRIYEHKEKFVKGFTEKYKVDRLLYYETFTDSISAISREKQLKKWKREWKLNLIKESNPELRDLYYDIISS